jgi:hypothetical protein
MGQFVKGSGRQKKTKSERQEYVLGWKCDIHIVALASTSSS